MEAIHLLSRASFGPSAASLEELQAKGLYEWLEEQLNAPSEKEEEREDSRLELALQAYKNASLPPIELVDHYQPGERPLQNDDKRPWKMRVATVDYNRLLSDVQMSELTRHMLSKFQLREVMVDFWVNHFNVYARKGDTKLLTSAWINEVIRPHALGRFADLLIATAHHPAMLIYLDNESSVRERANNRGNRGTNENYARELLELHTLGVNGGYDQADVKETARVLTGWSVARPPQGEFTFVFRAGNHAPGTKVVLKRAYSQGGEAEGQALLVALARHPSTARHIADKLCQRFVLDKPTAACVDHAAEAFLASGGETREVLKAIFLHPSFWTETARGQKYKTPLEFVMSAARSVNAEPDGGHDLVRALSKMGQEPLMERAPTGYPENASAWMSSASLLSRFQYAALFAAQWDAGITFDWSIELAQERTIDGLVATLNRQILASVGEKATLELLARELNNLPSTIGRRRLGLSLALSSAEFQRQ